MPPERRRGRWHDVVQEALEVHGDLSRLPAQRERETPRRAEQVQDDRDLGAAVRQAGMVRQLAGLAVLLVVALLGVGFGAWWLRRRRERRHS